MAYKHIHFKSIESTNDYAKDHFKELSNFTFITSDYQSSGRGQFDHQWISEKNKNILLSLILKEQENIDMKTLQMNVLEILIEFFKSYDINVRFKAPNDLYVKDKKICGLLIETSFTGHQCQYIVIGMGININQTTFKDFEATSLKTINKVDYNLKEIRNKLMTDLNQLNKI
ncbi:biotin--[acetyl-CoA-carboxylase] ligase [Mycoplasmatota bacterium]|nr:biotin--[acetyl-CoA-carboxylase] ligase [Mycoplasmatota bacterium]